MNTLPTPKRFKGVEMSDKYGLHNGSDTSYELGLSNPDYALALSLIVSRFVHLENEMAGVLSILLGLPELSPADYIMREIKSPRARLELMEALLEKAPLNRDRSEVWDKIISDFSGINTARNDYVHGQWFTGASDKSVYLAKLRDDQHGMWYAVAKPIPLDDLNALVQSIWDLNQLVWHTVAEIRIAEREAAQAQQPSPP